MQSSWALRMTQLKSQRLPVPLDNSQYLTNTTETILPDQSTSHHSYVPQTIRDSSNVIRREILLPRYFPQTLKNKACDWSSLKMAGSGPQ